MVLRLRRPADLVLALPRRAWGLSLFNIHKVCGVLYPARFIPDISHTSFHYRYDQANDSRGYRSQLPPCSPAVSDSQWKAQKPRTFGCRISPSCCNPCLSSWVRSTQFVISQLKSTAGRLLGITRSWLASSWHPGKKSLTPSSDRIYWI